MIYSSLSVNRLGAEIFVELKSNRYHRKLSREIVQDNAKLKVCIDHLMLTCVIYSPYINMVVQGWVGNSSSRWSWIVSRN
jgi:hypothetical protein